MKAAYILFNNITLLDFIGVYDPLSRLQSQGHLPDFSWDVCALTPTVIDGFGLETKVDLVAPDLSGYDLIIVPGGYGTRTLQHDPDFLAWLSTAAPVPLKTSVCTGALLLGAAGFLKGHRATTHFNEYEALAPYCATIVKNELVDDGAVITAGAVASSLDLGLYLCNKFVGPERTETVRESMAYAMKTVLMVVFVLCSSFVFAQVDSLNAKAQDNGNIDVCAEILKAAKDSFHLDILGLLGVRQRVAEQLELQGCNFENKLSKPVREYLGKPDIKIVWNRPWRTDEMVISYKYKLLSTVPRMKIPIGDKWLIITCGKGDIITKFFVWTVDE